MTSSDPECIKIFTESRGLVKHRCKRSYNFDAGRFNAETFSKPWSKTPGTYARYTWDENGAVLSPHLRIKEKLAVARSFETVENREQDLEFIEEVYRDGSSREPVWGDNGKTLHPAALLLPERERLQVEELDCIPDTLWGNHRPHRENFNNNLTCICGQDLLLASASCIQISSLEDVLDEDRGTIEQFEISLSEGYSLYCQDDDGTEFGYPPEFEEEDFGIHFIKVCRFYGHEVLCACTENGTVLIYNMEDVLQARTAARTEASAGRTFARLRVGPRVVLDVPGSCWSVDIFDDGNVKFIAAGHNGPGVTIFAHVKPNRTLVATEVPAKHNVPCVNFIKQPAGGGGPVVLAYASIFGNVSTVAIENDIGSRESMAVRWRYLDTQFFGDWCWTVTPVTKRAFHSTNEFEFLTNNYNPSYKERTVQQVYQDSHVLQSLPLHLRHSSHLGIGAAVAQLKVPVAELQLTNKEYTTMEHMVLRFTFFNLENACHEQGRYTEALIRDEYVRYASVIDETEEYPEDALFVEDSFFVLSEELPRGDEKVIDGSLEVEDSDFQQYMFARENSYLRAHTPAEHAGMMRRRVALLSQVVDPLSDHFRSKVEKNAPLEFVHFSNSGCGRDGAETGGSGAPTGRFPQIFRGVLHNRDTHNQVWQRETSSGFSDRLGLFDDNDDSVNSSWQNSRDNSRGNSHGSATVVYQPTTEFERMFMDAGTADAAGEVGTPQQDETSELETSELETSELETSESEAAHDETQQSVESMDLDSLNEQLQRILDNRDVALPLLNNDTGNSLLRAVVEGIIMRHREQHPPELDLKEVNEEMKGWALTNHANKVHRLLEKIDPETRFSPSGPKLRLPAADGQLFIVTTSKRVYLVNSDPLIVNAYTGDDVFQLDHIASCCFSRISRLNRISMVCFIEEFQCVAVASQAGLVSILRLTEYHGIHAFRQEYVFGWEHQDPLSEGARCMHTIVSPDQVPICELDDTILEMYNITGMDYDFVHGDRARSIPSQAILYVTCRDLVYRFRITDNGGAHN